MSKVLVIGDVHEPVTHPGYLEFCNYLQAKYDTNHTVFIGDIVDHHGISFHAKNPDCPGPKEEHALTLMGIHKWRNAFPDAEVMIGNHDERVHRLASTLGITKAYLRDYADVWDTPNWNWKFSTIIDDVFYFHGTGCSGVRPAFNRAMQSSMSVVMGHVHSVGGVSWMAGPNSRYFGMDTGCGVDVHAEAMAYGKHFARKPILSAGVVLDGFPFHEIMPAGRGEMFHRDKFKQKKGRRHG